MGVLTLLLVLLSFGSQAVPVNYTERSLTYATDSVEATITLEADVLHPNEPVPVRVTFTALTDSVGASSIGFYLEHIRSASEGCQAVTDDSVAVRYFCTTPTLRAGDQVSFELSGVPVGFVYPLAACDTIPDFIGVPFKLVLDGTVYLSRQQVVTEYQSGYCAYLPMVLE